jgi:hypothetical protein
MPEKTNAVANENTNQGGKSGLELCKSNSFKKGSADNLSAFCGLADRAPFKSIPTTGLYTDNFDQQDT